LFIMGESINPVRLSLFEASADTSPNLSSWRTDPPKGMHLFSRIGFASGVATLASVPSLIRVAFIPIEGERRGLNLFKLARKTGFSTWYFSSQGHHFLATAGGAPGAVRNREPE
jgi:glucan phosphoethanolaminetransferase (alkaline phosphatase superfamily)